jgi:hypothetical protein
METDCISMDTTLSEKEAITALANLTASMKKNPFHLFANG